MEKIKNKNNNENGIFPDTIYFKILYFTIDYLLLNNKKTNNLNQYNSHYNNNKYFQYLNEILKFSIVSKKWYNFISYTISNNIINNKLYENWFKIKYNNNFLNINNNIIINNAISNQFNFIYKKIEKRNIGTVLSNKKIKINQNFSIIKINQKEILNYFKNIYFLDQFKIQDINEIQTQLIEKSINNDNNNNNNNDNNNNKNLLDYEKIVVKVLSNQDDQLLKIFKLYSKQPLLENSRLLLNSNINITSNNPNNNIMDLNYEFNVNDDSVYNYNNLLKEFGLPNEVNEDQMGNDLNQYPNLYFNNLYIYGCNSYTDNDEDTSLPFKSLNFFKAKNLTYDPAIEGDPTYTLEYSYHLDYSYLFDVNITGQQAESIKMVNKFNGPDYIEPHHLIQLYEFENLHSLKIPLNFHDIYFVLFKNDFKNVNYFSNCPTSNLGYNTIHLATLKEDIKQMVHSIISCQSLKNLTIQACCSYKNCITKYIEHCLSIRSNSKTNFIDKFNEIKNEILSNNFNKLFSFENQSIERIKLNCFNSLNENTFSNLLQNKSIKYLHLIDSDFHYYTQPSGKLNIISINKYLFENIFSSTLCSIKTFKIDIINSNELKFIFNLILDNIFKLQLYSIIFNLKKYKNKLKDFGKELNDTTNYIIKKNLQLNNINQINLKEFILEINDKDEIKDLNNQIFVLTVKK